MERTTKGSILINAKVILDSVSPQGIRLTTIECTFHRFILPEVNTYRTFSRSAKSSRAIKLKDRIDEVRNNPAIPLYWGREQIGMVAKEELSEQEKVQAEILWLEAAEDAVAYAEKLSEMQVHKQTASRILEPFLWQTNVISSTEWDNMLKQRIHPDAQPEFKVLAEEIKKALDDSVPNFVNLGEWHLPYITLREKQTYNLETLQKASVARVARTSYGKKKEWNIDKDIELENRLFTADPKHYAPYEMIATPTFMPHVEGNFKGWRQLRHLI